VARSVGKGRAIGDRVRKEKRGLLVLVKR
jgi:hypothetical protein